MRLPILNELEKQPGTLNQVPHFEPANYLTCYTNADGSTAYYLEVKYRILWFRLCYPLGRIATSVKYDNNRMVAEARIYLDMAVPDHQYVAQAFVSKENNSDYNYIEWAQTAAIGRALAIAGFGQQFCDILDGPEPEQVDSPVITHPTPIDIQQTVSDVQQQPLQQSVTPENKQHAPSTIQPPHTQTPMMENYSSNSPFDFPDEDPYVDGPVVEVNAAPPSQQMPQQQAVNQANQPANTHTRQQNVNPSVTKQPPANYEAALQQLSPNDALAIVINFGHNKGNTLGELYQANDTNSLTWLAQTYKGRDFMVKAGAHILLTALQQQAS